MMTKREKGNEKKENQRKYIVILKVPPKVH